MQVQTILSQIDLGALALPEFQRGYVWNREQVRRLLRSLYLRHPVGSLLVWVTKTESADARGDGELQPGSVKLILDGQQRITTLYGIVQGKAPEFFEGNAQTFTGLHFSLEEETFEFYSAKMKDDPLWINVTRLMQEGVGPCIQGLIDRPELSSRIPEFINRLTALYGIRDVELHIQEVTGQDKTVDVVVEIFNQVNSGGTKLSKGDLALARVCGMWPQARGELKSRLAKWRRAGFNFKLDWFLRCINTVSTGEARFSALQAVDTSAFQQGMQEAEKAIDYLLNLVSARLGLDHDRVLGSRYSFPLMARYLIQRGGHLHDYQERDKLLYWYVHTLLWGRYTGSTESVLDQDLALIEQSDGALDRLINQLRQQRGSLRLSPEDFRGWSRGARFYPMLYMLTRVWHAKDWDTGIDLRDHLLGKLSRLQLHHIFPKALLYKHGYDRREVNAIANFTFLTQETNLAIANRPPSEYLEEFAARHPGAVESHWIPADRSLWRVEKYRDFLAARRELLARAANEFLDSLLAGAVPEQEVTPPILERAAQALLGGVASEAEEELLIETAIWVADQGLPEGELMFELIDPDTQEPLALLDLAWPNGLQEGYSPPVAVLLDEGREVEELANQAGFRYFTDVDAFREYVRREVLAQEIVARE